MKQLKKLEIVKKTLVELSNKQTKELKGGNIAAGTTACSPDPRGTQVNTCQSKGSCC